jgi:large subunit ribosomal protein L28
MPRFGQEARSGIISVRKDLKMAVCAHCDKKTTFGNRRSFSMNATKRKFKPNLQKVTLYENGRKVKKVLCAKCIKTLGKSA